MNMYVKSHLYKYVQKVVCINSVFPAGFCTLVEHNCCNHALDKACFIFVMNFAKRKSVRRFVILQKSCNDVVNQ